MVGRFEGIFVTSSLIKERWYCSWGRKRKKKSFRGRNQPKQSIIQDQIATLLSAAAQERAARTQPRKQQPRCAHQAEVRWELSVAARGQPCPALLLLASACSYFTSGCARSLQGTFRFPFAFLPFSTGRRSLADSKRDTFPGTETVCFSPALSPDSLLWFCSFSERRSVIIS